MEERELFKRAIAENLADKESIRRNVLKAAHPDEANRKRGGAFRYLKVAAIPIAACMVFIVSVNVSPSFALAVSDVPLLGTVAEVVTVKQYSHRSDSDEITVKVPKIQSTGNSSFEKRINHLIEEKMDQLAKQAEKEAASFRKNYLAMGNTETDYVPSTYQLDYTVKSAGERYLSFIINQVEETNGMKFTTYYYFNLNVKSGKTISLKDLLGGGYEEKVNHQIEDQIRKRAEEDPNLWSYYQEFCIEKGTKPLDIGQDFYVNKAGNPVVVFDEYEVAPEYAGVQEFELKFNI